jgi:uncharacterized coiled-coil protein SlyX
VTRFRRPRAFLARVALVDDERVQRQGDVDRIDLQVAAVRQELAVVREELRALTARVEAAEASVTERMRATDERVDVVLDELSRRTDASLAELRDALASLPPGAR